MADDLGIGMSTLNKWITAHRDTDVVSKEGLSLATTWDGPVDEGIEQAQGREELHERERREAFQKDIDEVRDVQGDFKAAHDERGRQ